MGDPAVLAGHTKVLTAPTPLIHNPPVLPVVHHAPVAPVAAYAGLGYGLGYHGLGYGLAHAVVKRDADPAVIAGRTTVLSAPTPLSSQWSIMPLLLPLPLLLLWVMPVLATMVLATDFPLPTPLSRGTLRLTLLWFLVPSHTLMPQWLPLLSMPLPPLVLWLTPLLSRLSLRPLLRSAM